MSEKYDDRDGDSFPHKYTESESRRMIEREFLGEEMRAKATQIAIRALGDVGMVCESCGGVCDEHSIKLRDAFFKRARTLTDKLYIGLDLYLQEREFGVIEPVETINGIYRLWAELACLHDLVEPQTREEHEENDDDDD